MAPRQVNIIWVLGDQLRAQALGCNGDPNVSTPKIDRPWRGVVTADGWKYIVLEGQPWLMFNLNEDPCEFINLAHNSMFKADRQRLQACLAKWINDTGDEFDLPDVG